MILLRCYCAIRSGLSVSWCTDVAALLEVEGSDINAYHQANVKFDYRLATDGHTLNSAHRETRLEFVEVVELSTRRLDRLTHT